MRFSRKTSEQVVEWATLSSTDISDFAAAVAAVGGGGGGSGSGGQLAYAYDISGTATVISTTGTTSYITGLGISVPPSTRPVKIRWGMVFQVTAAGNGSLVSQCYEGTSGGAILLGTVSNVGGWLIGTNSQVANSISGEVDLGPTTVERQFILGAAIGRDAGSTLAASVRSTTTGVSRAWMEAVAL